MKKVHFSLLSFVALLVTANAQHAQFGFTAGAVLNNYHVKPHDAGSDLKAKAGISLGIVAGIPMGKHFSFQPALNYLQKGAINDVSATGITETYKPV